jgi:hypothetical protein
MLIIMWTRVCIILHNLIIRIEGDNFDTDWRETLVEAGQDRRIGADEEEEGGDALQLAQWWVEIPGQRFRLHLMQGLFNTSSRSIQHHP